jgi:hypothetical protein
MKEYTALMDDTGRGKKLENSDKNCSTPLWPRKNPQGLDWD